MSDEKPKTVPDILDEIVEQMCDEYCRFPYEIEDEDRLYKEKCENCPLTRLL